MNPNPDETSPASGRQQSKSLEEIAWEATKAGSYSSTSELEPIILRALQAATAESEKRAGIWMRLYSAGKLPVEVNEAFHAELKAAARQQERSQR